MEIESPEDEDARQARIVLRVGKGVDQRIRAVGAPCLLLRLLVLFAAARALTLALILVLVFSPQRQLGPGALTARAFGSTGAPAFK